MAHRERTEITHPEFGTQSVPAKTVAAWQEVGWADSTAEPPARSAEKAEWVEFAVTQGMARDDAKKKTKDQLIKALAPTEES